MKALAAVTRFLFREVAGICPLAPGWTMMRVKPSLTHRLRSAEARVQTARGAASVAWQRDPERLAVDIGVPATSRADVWLPVAGFDALRVREVDDLIWSDDQPAAAPGFQDVQRVGDHVRLAIGGGFYRFVVSGSS